MSNLENLLGREHPDIKYLRQDKISLVLSKALSETYLEQPNDPIQFFAKYLLNHVNQQKIAEQEQCKFNEVRAIRTAYSKVCAEKKEEEEKVVAAKLTVEEKKA